MWELLGLCVVVDLPMVELLPARERCFGATQRRNLLRELAVGFDTELDADGFSPFDGLARAPPVRQLMIATLDVQFDQLGPVADFEEQDLGLIQAL